MAEVEEGVPGVWCIGCLLEGTKKWGLHTFQVEDQVGAVCFLHLYRGREDAAKAEVNRLIIEAMPKPKPACFLIETERMLGLDRANHGMGAPCPS